MYSLFFFRSLVVKDKKRMNLDLRKILLEVTHEFLLLVHITMLRADWSTRWQVFLSNGAVQLLNDRLEGCAVEAHMAVGASFLVYSSIRQFSYVWKSQNKDQKSTNQVLFRE